MHSSRSYLRTSQERDSVICPGAQTRRCTRVRPLTGPLQASAETIETLGRRLVDAVIVTVQHNMHRDVVLAFAAQGYRILCEKPLATTARDCFDMEVFVCFRLLLMRRTKAVSALMSM
ncbi:hypothetical protein BKA82DRAFT_4098954, partial [Pisolithus tinctorius]